MKWDGREKCNVYKMERWAFQTCVGDLSKWWIRKLSVIRSCVSITAREITRRDSYGAPDCISMRCSHYWVRVESILIFSRAENQAYWSRLMKDHPLQPPFASAIQTTFLENHFIKNQHCIATTASSHNTTSNLHQSFCCGKLDELRETARSVITDGKMWGFCFGAFIFEASIASSIMAEWWEIKGKGREGDFLH